MSEIRETLFRYLALLQLIPRSPGRISTTVLLEKLHERGFHIDTRSLQRDLRDRLSLHFPLGCDDSQKPYRWYFDRDEVTPSRAAQAIVQPLGGQHERRKPHQAMDREAQGSRGHGHFQGQGHSG